MMLVNSIYIHNLYISTYKKYVYVFLLMGQTLKLASKESPCSSADFPAYSILCMRIRWSPFTQHKDSTLHRENCGPGVQACAAEFVASKVSVPFPGHSQHSRALSSHRTGNQAGPLWSETNSHGACEWLSHGRKSSTEYFAEHAFVCLGFFLTGYTHSCLDF